MIKTLFQLFLAFAKIGFTSFGGTSMIPLIMEEMLSHNWMTADDVANIVAIAEMTPGSLGVNCATFAGTQTAGLGIGLLCFWLLRKKKMAIPKVIGIAAVLGLVCFGVL